jgi:excisionase family DNA binding protein
VEEFEGWLTTREAAELVGFHQVYIRRLLGQGKIEGKKFAREWLVNRESLLDYKARMEARGTEKHNPWRDDLPAGHGRDKNREEQEK